jgi:hypothetical protein
VERSAGVAVRPAIFVALALALVAAPAEASCQKGSSFCFCTSPARFAVVITESLSGAKATVRVQRAGTGTTEGELIEVPRAANETVGARWLLRDAKRQEIDAKETVGCGELGEPSGVRVATDTVMTALADPSTCDAQLEAAGFVLPCSDTGGRCAVAPAGLVALAMLAWVRRRRRG